MSDCFSDSVLEYIYFSRMLCLFRAFCKRCQVALTWDFEIEVLLNPLLCILPKQLAHIHDQGQLDKSLCQRSGITRAVRAVHVLHVCTSSGMPPVADARMGRANAAASRRAIGVPS